MTASLRTGRCACGTLTFEAEVESDYSVCHCSLCRRWAGAPVMAVQARELRFSPPDALRRWQSSDWAERGNCAICGSALCWRLLDGSLEMVSVGALDDQSGLRMVEEVFVDEQPAHYRFAGAEDRERLTGPELMLKLGGGEAGRDGKDG